MVNFGMDGGADGYFNLVKLGMVNFGMDGGAEGDRTPDLMHAMHALSQLSYSPTKIFNVD
jgi:hypothetical protein